VKNKPGGGTGQLDPLLHIKQYSIYIPIPVIPENRQIQYLVHIIWKLFSYQILW